MKQAMCSLCTYAAWLAGRFPGILLCFNHPDLPGQVREVGARGCCRNFRAVAQPPLRLPAPAPPNPRVRLIPLTQGQFAMVDVEDFARLNQYRWYACRSKSGTLYAIMNLGGGKTISMHRFLMNPPKGMVVDHIDGNGLNNCRCNLRICTRQENCCNRRPIAKSSHFIGIGRHEEVKWRARVICKRKCWWAGVFHDEIEAALARDLLALALHGPYARFNFPAIIRAILRARQALPGGDTRQETNEKSGPAKPEASDARKTISDKSGSEKQQATNDPALARVQGVLEALARAQEPATGPASRKTRKKAG